MDIKLRGPRIAVSDVEGVNTTGLHFPENSQRAYVFGEVIALGDNVISTGKAPYHFSVGDIIVFQANPMMMANCRFEVNKKKMLVMLQGDALHFDYLSRDEETALPGRPERKALPRASAPEPDEDEGDDKSDKRTTRRKPKAKSE